jgi:hypothetical protein
LQDTIVIDEEGQLPRCENCDFSSRLSVSVRRQEPIANLSTAIHQKREADVADNQTVAEAVVVTVQGATIETVQEFNYLGRYDVEKWQRRTNSELEPEASTQYRISRIRSREGACPKAMATFYKAIVQSVLLYGSES